MSLFKRILTLALLALSLDEARAQNIGVYSSGSVERGGTRQLSAYVPLSPNTVTNPGLGGMLMGQVQQEYPARITSAPDQLRQRVVHALSQIIVISANKNIYPDELVPYDNGPDHGWGNHHLIMGGGARGGDLYDAFPNLALGGPDDTGNRGVLIPTTSLDQFGAPCAKWFGVTPEDMASVFPNLGNFATGDLGFMV